MADENQATPQPADAPPQEVSAQQPGDVKYASFLARFVAALIDGILVAVVAGVLGYVFGVTSFTTTGGEAGYSNPFQPLVGIIYAVFMLVKYGATLGKMALGIRVQDAETGANLTVVQAVLREVVGKFVSAVVFLLGFFWMLWDSKKQTWHDKIAKSVVVKTK